MAILALAMIGSGCTTSIGGGAESSAPATSPSRAPIAVLPPRPELVRLDRVDPCLVFTEQQQREFAFDRPTETLPPGPRDEQQCVYGHSFSSPIYDYVVGLVTTEGAETWLAGTRIVDVRPMQVAGFGAVEVRTVGDADFDCVVTVDVADGQSLDVAFVSGEDEFSEDDLCERARVGAEAAMATLLTR